MKPNFLFIGPDKTGSTWIYNILRQHPNCYVPLCKDLYFFDRNYSRGLNWYFSFFSDASVDDFAVGELSHDYLFSIEAAERIKTDLPNVKLLTCLRNPIERTFSHYLFMIRSARTKNTFEESLDLYPELINNSLYFKHLKEYYRLFSKEQIKVLFFRDLVENNISFAKQIFEFLDIPFIDNLSYSEKTLPASQARSFMLVRLLKYGANIFRLVGYPNLVGAIKGSSAANLMFKPYEPDQKPSMSPAAHETLRRHFTDDITQLQDLLEVDLSEWLNSGTIVGK